MFALNSIGINPPNAILLTGAVLTTHSVSWEASPKAADTPPCGTVSPSAGLYQGVSFSEFSVGDLL